MDTSLFHLINQGLQNPVFDASMVFITNNRNVLFIAVLAPLFFKDWRKGFLAFTLCMGGFIVASSGGILVKHLLGRLRPCHALENVRLLIECNKSFSFPSIHAATSFAMAFIISYFYTPATVPALIAAFLVAFSRIYVGVHYPSDVIAGAVWGCIAAGIILIVHNRLKGHIKS